MKNWRVKGLQSELVRVYDILIKLQCDQCEVKPKIVFNFYSIVLQTFGFIFEIPFFTKRTCALCIPFSVSIKLCDKINWNLIKFFPSLVLCVNMYLVWLIGASNFTIGCLYELNDIHAVSFYKNQSYKNQRWIFGKI